MSTIILFPGLGASEKLFQLYSWGGRKTHVAKFLIPDKKEKLEDYVQRLANSIPYCDDLIFIGVSFGGILAQEVSKLLPPKKIILISTIKSKSEKPFYFFIFRILQIYWLLTTWTLRKGLILLSELTNPKSDEERKLFITMVKESDIRVIRWGIHQTLHWKQEDIMPGMTHIHGSKDAIFPIQRIRTEFIIPGGTHFMVIRRAKEINEVINRLINQVENPG